jgi:hypothetical protein
LAYSTRQTAHLSSADPVETAFDEPVHEIDGAHLSHQAGVET